MLMFTYTLSVTFEDAHTGAQWLSWMRDEHLAEVCAAGALDAEVIAADATTAASSPGHPRYEVRYHFSSREAFARYERDHAPRLRAAGLKRFAPERGVKYERWTGEVALSHPPERAVPSRAD